ncbi:MAG: hypothetical protein ACK47B_10510 [Armatimonadota bacterium]
MTGRQAAMGAESRLRRSPSLIAAVLLVVSALTGLSASTSEPAEKDALRGPGASAAVELTNGDGDGRATMRVDAYGSFTDLEYDPVGEVPAAGTTFFSGLWFSGINRSGQGGGGLYLSEAALGEGSFSLVENTRARSEWTHAGLAFELLQEMLPASERGSTFRQVYTIRNAAESEVAFDLIRFLDGDLRFDESISDFGGVAQGGQLLFEFDSGQNPSAPTTFLGIDMDGAANLGYRVAQYPFAPTISSRGAAALNNTLTFGSGNTQNADTDGDGITDSGYDVTLSMGRSFQLQPGQIVRLIVNTIMGEGAPTEVVVAPSNLSAEPVAGPAVELRWTDNSTGELGFIVERKAGAPDTSGQFAVIGQAGPDAESFRDNEVTGGRTYTYRVKAFFSEGETVYSDVATATVPEPNLPPGFVGPTPDRRSPFFLRPRQALEFTIRADDPNSGDPVKLEVSGLPATARQSPALPAVGNPVASTFTWNLSPEDAGIYELLYTATDASELSVQRLIRLVVNRIGVCFEGEIDGSEPVKIDGFARLRYRGSKIDGGLTAIHKRRKQTLRSTSITRLTINGRVSTVEGTAKINGKRGHTFKLVVTENGPGPKDRLETLVVDGETWGAGRLVRKGDVHFHAP